MAVSNSLCQQVQIQIPLSSKGHTDTALTSHQTNLGGIVRFAEGSTLDHDNPVAAHATAWVKMVNFHRAKKKERGVLLVSANS
jgi:hypothetical protein